MFGRKLSFCFCDVAPCIVLVPPPQTGANRHHPSNRHHSIRWRSLRACRQKTKHFVGEDEVRHKTVIGSFLFPFRPRSPFRRCCPCILTLPGVRTVKSFLYLPCTHLKRRYCPCILTVRGVRTAKSFLYFPMNIPQDPSVLVRTRSPRLSWHRRARARAWWEWHSKKYGKHARHAELLTLEPLPRDISVDSAVGVGDYPLPAPKNTS